MKGVTKNWWPGQKCPISLQYMQIWGLNVHEILYIECVGVPIMFLDELLTYKFAKKSYRVLS